MSCNVSLKDTMNEVYSHLPSLNFTGPQIACIDAGDYGGMIIAYLENGTMKIYSADDERVMHSFKMPDDIADPDVVEFTVVSERRVIVRNGQGVAATLEYSLENTSLPEHYLGHVEGVMRVAGGTMLIHDGQFAVDGNNEYIPLGTVEGKLAIDIIPDGMSYAYIAAEHDAEESIQVGDVVLSNGNVVYNHTYPESVECIVDGYVLFANGDLVDGANNQKIQSNVAGITKVGRRTPTDLVIASEVDADGNPTRTWDSPDFTQIFNDTFELCTTSGSGVSSGSFDGSDLDSSLIPDQLAQMQSPNPNGAPEMIIVVKDGQYHILNTDDNTLSADNVVTGSNLSEMLTIDNADGTRSVRNLDGKAVLETGATEFPYFEGEASQYVFAR